MLSPRVKKQIEALADEMAGLFTPPELIAGCEVLAVDDKDQYASDNGWIEARVGQHNRQRCRWRGQFYNVEVGDFVDVLFFASYRLFVVFGQGGTGAAAGPLAHNLLSANHPDTLAASPPAAGDLITGNDTPQWARLARGQSGQYVTPNSTTGELEWRDIPTIGITEFLYDVASDIATYSQMAPDVPTGAAQTIVSAAVSADDTLIFNLATNANNPGVDFINDGVWHLHLHAQKSGPGTKDVQLKFRVYSRTDPGGVETQIGTGYSESTANLTTSEAEYDLRLALDELAIDLTDRIVLKIYADVSGAGSDPTVTVTVEGDTDARLEIPAVIAASGGGWPFANVLTVSTTDPNADYTTVTAAIAAASAGDGILLDMESSSETVTVNKAVTIIGWDRAGTVFTNSMTITAAATLVNIKVNIASGTNSKGFIVSANAVFINCEAITSGTSTSRAIDQSAGNSKVFGGYYESGGAGTSIEIFVSGGSCSLIDPILSGGDYSGTVLGTYRDLNGNMIIINELRFVTGASRTSGVWLDDVSDGLLRKYADLAAAAAAAAAGDVIWLGPGTHTLTAQIAYGAAFTIRGMGTGRTIINCATNGVSLLLLNSAGAALRDVTITHSGAGVLNSGVYITANATVENVTVTLSGAATANYAILQQGGTATLTNVTATASGATTNHAYRNDTGDATVIFNGGRLSGTQQDIYGERAGSSLYLNNTVLVNRLADWDGTVSGSIDPRLVAFTQEIYQGTNIGLSDFVATINGAPSGASVVYNAPSSGNEAMLVPTVTTHIAKMVLHNTTRGDEALISNCNTGTNTITLTANAPAGWQSGDTITVRSQTNTSTFGSAYFVDFEIVSDVDPLAVGLEMELTMADSGGAGQSVRLHPYQASVVALRRGITTQSTSAILGYRPLPLISRRFCATWTASGSATITAFLFRALKQLVYGL